MTHTINFGACRLTPSFDVAIKVLINRSTKYLVLRCLVHVMWFVAFQERESALEHAIAVLIFRCPGNDSISGGGGRV